MTGLLICGVTGVILLRGVMTRTDVYSAFLRGAEAGMRSAVRLLPALCGMLLMLRLMQASGALEALSRLLTPVTSWAGVPAEVTPLLLLRPLTGSGSIAALEELLRAFGPDSRTGRLASALMGSSETIFYTMTVYAGAAGVRRAPGALAASLAGYAAGVIVCVMMTQ